MPRRLLVAILVVASSVQITGTAGSVASDDVTPPDPLWVMVSPEIDVAVGGDVTVTVGITESDPVAGGYVRFREPVAHSDPQYRHVSLQETTSLDGTRILQGSVHIVPWTTYGVWAADILNLYDGAGNQLDLRTPEAFAAAGLAVPTMVVAGTPDLERPEILSMTLAPDTVPLTVWGTMTVTIEARDDVSGISQLQAWFSPAGDSQICGGYAVSFEVREGGLVSGTLTAGVFEGELWTRPGLQLGQWRPCEIWVTDRYGRMSGWEIENGDDPPIALPTFEIVDFGAELPRVLSLDIDPEWVSNEAPAEIVVTMEFTDDYSGYERGSVHLSNATGDAFLDIALDAIIGGTPQEGVAQGTYLLPQGLPAGPWHVTMVGVIDLDGHSGSRYAADLLADGIALPLLSVVDGTGRPSLPRAVTAQPGAAGDLEVTWAAPAYPGTSAVTYSLDIRVAGAAPSSPVFDPDSLESTAPVPDIVGGYAASIEEFPWQGALLVASQLDAGVAQFCGASLIAPLWAVTAAHCVDDATPEELHLAFGQTLLSAVQVRDRVPVTAIVVHPAWDEESMGADIALLRLAAVPTGGHPIGIPTDPSRPTLGTSVWASGWGNVVSSDPAYSGYLPDNLLAVGMWPRAGYEEQECGYWGSLYNPVTHLCAGHTLQRRGPCVGDSGGPLAFHGDTYTWMLAGITSFGPAPISGDCGYYALPSVFTRVTTYADWIASYVDDVIWAPAGVTPATSLVVSGLEPGIEYEVRIAAVNLSGSSGTMTASGYTGGSPRHYPWPLRLAGINRFGTAAAIVQQTFPATANTVFVATGMGYADALTGSAVAGAIGAPLLLVYPESVPAETRAELARLDPATIVILGGPGAVSDAVAADLAGYGSVVRLAGATRYDTAVEISQYAYPDGADFVLISTGTNFADALAGAPAAATVGGPILLTLPNQLPAAVMQEIGRLSPQRVIVLGGTAAVSSDVFQQLLALAPEVVRVAGSSRYDTAIEVNRAVFGAAATAYVATGLNFPDALAGAAAAAHEGAPLYLVTGTGIPAGLIEAMHELGVTSLVIIGGSAAISDQVWLNLGLAVGPS